jgi:hypothetical protein
MAKVEVTEATTDGILTTTITVIGEEKEFLLANLLAQRKAITPKATVLKNAVAEAIRGYLESAEEVISGVKSEQKKETAANNESNGKRGRKNKEDVRNEDVEIANTRPKRMNETTSAAAFSGD